MRHTLLGLALALALLPLNPGAGQAQVRLIDWHGDRSHWSRHDWDSHWHHGHWHRGHHGGRFGWWWVIGPSWYYYSAPVYPYPPQVVIVPPPQPQVYQAPAPAPYCREYQGDAIINGTNQRFYGTACLEPDGQWHIVK